MEPGSWDDIKRVHDEAERILRGPYDMSLMVSFNIHSFMINRHLLERRAFRVAETSLLSWSVQNA